MPSKVERIATQIQSLPLSRVLLLASMAVEQGQLDLAEICVSRANDLLAAKRLLGVEVK